jgi:peptidoglycan/LPS O-acetylase OafA/YrhL
MLKNQQYYDALDGLRTICIIFTVIDHTAGNPGINGTVGVDVFFALSGYLITTLLLRERDKTGQVCLPCFYIRRFFRIVPLYLLAIMLYFPGVWLSYKLTGNTKGLADFNSALPWLSTLNSEWRPDNGNNLFGHAWTLGVEEKFYILWPFLFPLIAVRKRGLLLLAAMPLLACGGPSMTRGYIGILFGVIAALAIQQDDRGVAFIRKVPTSLWAGLMVVGYFVATGTGNLYLNLLISLPAALFIAALINKEKDFYQMVLSFPILVWLGKLTYVIYLIHRLVGNTFEQLLTKLGRHPGFVMSFVMVYGACIPAAWFLHVTVEQPLIKFGRGMAGKRRNIPNSAGIVRV